ncbi:MAG: toll/interleukin-1 receptor domain-containing protein [Candidatus Poribacteria bacterium]|nr:toll/interleukin-1 receptor domain-containing protein [Candidatus Poribacteria bacterium]
MMAENPKVFISYSHDSPEHKRWVSELAARLRHNGIDAILDQWDLGLGDDITRFMERGIVDADRVLVICTGKYVNKANAGEGGVGYERMIVNAELVQNLGTDKFIPIIRQASGKEKTPTFLGTRVYADFTRDSQFDAECEKLIRELHEMPIIEKPPLGKSPFPPVESDTQLTEISEKVKSASEVYQTASKLVRTGDTLGWRELIKHIRPNVFKTLVQWRQDELGNQKPENIEQLVQVVDRAIEIVSPLMVVALAGVESGREEFRDQRSLLDDLLNIAGWNFSGYTTWANIPNALGYVYHSLHGGLCLSTNQIALALSLVRVKVRNTEYGGGYHHIWKKKNLVGWTDSLGSSCTESWDYLVKAVKSGSG